MTTALIFIAVLAVLVLSHELGHFLVARFSGVAVHEFGFGFAPCLASYAKVNGRWQWRLGKIKDAEASSTIYTVNLLPLGGFVRLKGENAFDSDANDKDSFQNKSAWVKTAIVVAGVIMNALVAWLMLTFIFMAGMPEPVPSAQSIAPGAPHYIQVLEVQPNGPAASTGLADGDEIIAVDALAEPNTVSFKEYIQTKKDQAVDLKVRRGSNILSIKVTPRSSAAAGPVLIGVGIVDVQIKKMGLFTAIKQGAVTTIDYIGQILYGFWQLIHSVWGGPGVQGEVAGPVGVAILTGRAARLGIIYLIHFSAVLSLNLAVLNVLPVPALDGGRLLFIIINAFRRKPVSPQTEHGVHAIFFFILIVLIIAITAKDIFGLVGPWWHRLN